MALPPVPAQTIVPGNPALAIVAVPPLPALPPWVAAPPCPPAMTLPAAPVLPAAAVCFASAEPSLPQAMPQSAGKTDHSNDERMRAG